MALIVATYWIARRAALGLEATTKAKDCSSTNCRQRRLFRLATAVLPHELSAVVEKELRYAMRNAQVRMMALMPLILIVIRVVNSAKMWNGATAVFPADFLTYGSGLLVTGGMLYVFLILAGLSS